MPPLIHDHSHSVVQLQLRCSSNGEIYDYATGFFFQSGSHIFLVTNHHVVTSLKPGTRDHIRTDGRIPKSLGFDFSGLEPSTQGTDERMARNFKAIVPLYEFDNNNEVIFEKPRWHEHPTLGNDCDVVAIKWDPSFSNLHLDTTKEIAPIKREREEACEIELTVMEQLFITGFPLIKEKSYSRFPIYKSGSLASEPQDATNGPNFYVDAKTKPGMSGSPVLHRIPLNVTSNERGQITVNSGRVYFVGIYSGRAEIMTDEYQAELGIVWPFRECLLPIIDSAIESIQS